MNKVYINGIGQVPVQESWEHSLKELAGFAGLAAMEDAGLGYPQGLFVGNMLSLSANKQGHLATLLADWLGCRILRRETVRRKRWRLHWFFKSSFKPFFKPLNFFECLFSLVGKSLDSLFILLIVVHELVNMMSQLIFLGLCNCQLLRQNMNLTL